MSAEQMSGATVDPMQNIFDVIDGVDGWLSYDQAARLAKSASACPDDGQIVEIGSFRGRSTIVLATAAPDGVTTVAIDPHAGNDRGPQQIDGFAVEAATDFDVFHRNLVAARVAQRVRHVRAFSDRAHAEVIGSIDVLYIDGAHRYRPAEADIRTWGARVRPGGTLLIHDSFSSVGVTCAIVRHLFGSKQFTYVGRSRSLAEYRATPPGWRVGNATRQTVQLGWFARNLCVKVLISCRADRLIERVTGRRMEWPY